MTVGEEIVVRVVAGVLVWGPVVGLIAAVPLVIGLHRTVARLMRRGGRPQRAEPAVATRDDAAPLQLEKEQPPSEPRHEAARGLFARIRRARRRAVVCYLAAGMAAACVMAAGEAAANPDLPLNRMLLPLNHTAPVLLTVSVIAVVSFRRRLAPLVAAYLILIVVTTLANGEDSFELYAFPGTILLMLVANRWLKTLAPLMMLIAAACVAPLQVAWRLTEAGYDPSFSLGFFAAIPAGLYGIHLLVRAYARKWFSDLSLQFAVIWLVFAMDFTWVYVRLWWYPAGALAVYAILTRVMLLLLLRRPAGRHAPASLLVLRVFGAPSRSRRLFEELGTRWRYIGPIHLIAGVDSAVTNLDPAEALRFLTFRFRSLYVIDPADAEHAQLDCAPDPDGRYRVNDFFCSEDAWKPMFGELLHRSHAVLVDLSGYSPQNQGVSFELGQLLATRPLDSFVLVTDRRTDLEHLHASMAERWRRLDPMLPNARLRHPTVRVLHEPASPLLVSALCDAAVAGGWRDEPSRARGPASSRPRLPSKRQ